METDTISKNGVCSRIRFVNLPATVDYKPTPSVGMRKFLLKVAVVTISAFAFWACNGDDPVDTPTLQTVEFTFGPGSTNEINPTTNISKAGADKNVGKIKIKSNGGSWNGAKVSELADMLIDPAFDAANGKGTGDGTKLVRVQIDNKGDSIRLHDVYGYIFENCYVPEH